MGKASRDKGAGYERELVNAFKDRGLAAQRVPLSGATDYAKNDVEVIAGFDGKTKYCGEAKRRAGLPKFFTEALDGADFAAFRQDRGETLIVLRLDTFADLLQ
jgi:Holliday junction resolvase